MKQQVTLFEILPNEILIECLKYFNAVDLLRSFDRLNYRFHLLIYGLPLYVNFHNVKKPEFNEFCSRISSCTNIKNQIHSLQLSNTNDCQIHHFLNLFSLTDFVHLRSLTLIEVQEHNLPQLTSILPSLTQLICVRLVNYQAYHNPLLSSQLQILQTPFLFSKNQLLYDISSVRSLTIKSCNIVELNEILLYASKLEYLHIQQVFTREYSTKTYDRTLFERNRAIHVRKLIFIEFSADFSELVMTLNQTPNLEYLTVYTKLSKSLGDAKRWRDLITSSLPNLRIFNFKFEQKSTNFGQNEYQWHTKCMLTEASACIYSIPYILEEFVLTSETHMHENTKMISKNGFNKVRNLSIDPCRIEDNCEYYFPNVTVLQIGDLSSLYRKTVLTELHVKYLPKIVNLMNIKSLRFTFNCQLRISTVLLLILEQAPNISALGIAPNLLMSLFDDDNLCRYLKKMIESLDLITEQNSNVLDVHEMNSIWTTFSNITYLKCRLVSPGSAIYLIQQLPKLLRLDFTMGPNAILASLFYCENDIKRKLGIKIISDSILKDELVFFNWIIRNKKSNLRD